MMPYFLMLVATAFSLCEGTAIKIYNKKHSDGGFLFTATVSFFSMLFFLFKYLITEDIGSFDPKILPYAIAAGIMYCVGSFLTYLALMTGSFAISMMVLSYSIVLTSGYGIIFLREQASVCTYIGFALVAISLFLLRGKPSKESEEKRVSLKWIIYITVSVLCTGGFSIVTRMQQEVFSESQNSVFLTIALGFSTFVLFAVGTVSAVRKKSFLKTLKLGAPYASFAGISNALTNYFGLVINMMIAISISGPTRSVMKNLLSFLISVFIIKEKFLPRQIIGLILSTVAVVLINIT